MSTESKIITGAQDEANDSFDRKFKEIMSSTMKREHDSTDDFERVEPENLFATESTITSKKEETGAAKEEEAKGDATEQQRQQQTPRVQDHSTYSTDSRVVQAEQVESSERPLLPDEGLTGAGEEEERAVPATPPPSADIEKYNSMADPFQRPAGKTASADPIDPRAATIAFVETERQATDKLAQSAPASGATGDDTLLLDFEKSNTAKPITSSTTIDSESKMNVETREKEPTVVSSTNLLDLDSFETISAPPAATKSEPEIIDLLSTSNHKSLARADEDSKSDSKNNLPQDEPSIVHETESKERNDVNVIDKDSLAESTIKRKEPSPEKTVNSEKKAESKAPSGKTTTTVPVTQEAGSKDSRYPGKSIDKIQEIEIAPKEIFSDMGLDAWFNPERLHPRVAALIYWRDPQKSGAVFGATLGLLLSLAYFSLISVLAYLSLLILTFTVVVRIYKSVLQAIQKTSDGHPFKYILDLNLTLPNEKVHQLADVAVAHLNETVSELRRLFLVEDIVDSLKFGVLLWCFTYIGSWFNGMSLIIIGVVALFTLPKVYETNKTQIDENMALVKEHIEEFTAKIKAAIPLVKKPEPTKED